MRRMCQSTRQPYRMISLAPKTGVLMDTSTGGVRSGNPPPSSPSSATQPMIDAIHQDVTRHSEDRSGTTLTTGQTR